MAVFDLNQPASSLSEEDDVAASNSHVVSVSSSINTRCDSFASHDDNASFCGCKARVVFDMVPHTTKYTLTTFDVEHNHELDRVEYKHLSKAERRLTYNEQLFIIKAANANIGAMLITRMEKRQEYTKDFSFDYFVEDAELCGLFWTDEVAKCNYKEFCDIVSFDATYKTNKYKMVFVSFTAIDNHRRSVTVGSVLLKKETVEAYGWLLRAFKKAFVRAPNIFVIDKMGAMRLAGVDSSVWIYQKLQENGQNRTNTDTGKERVYKSRGFDNKKGQKSTMVIQGDKVQPGKRRRHMNLPLVNPQKEFEDRWNKLMEEFNLVNHKWLSKMYRLRSSWIPTFFVDSPLCGLMRTTSSLPMETAKGPRQEKLDHQLFDSFPALRTTFTIEEHASRVNTCSLFIHVQQRDCCRVLVMFNNRTPQLHQDIRNPNKRVSFSTGVIPNTRVSRPQLKSNHLEDRVMSNNSQGKKQEVEDHRRKFKSSNNKTSVTALKMEILLEPTSNKLLVGLDDGVAASFQRSRIHKPHAHTQAFKVNHSTSR
ncbi:ankyrin repeat-containing domain-containing LTR copia-type protein [Tanacetum coccineum]